MNPIFSPLLAKPDRYSKWLLLAALFTLFFRLGAAPVYILDEARNAQCAREMMLRGDWIVPTFNGVLRTDKPVLHYYAMGAAYRIFGVNAFAARFFSALLGFLTLWATWGFARRLSGPGVAFWSLLVLCLSTHFLFEFRMAVPDPYLIFFVTVSLYSFFLYVQTSHLKWLAAGAAGAGLAVLAKGPVALVLPGAAVLVWLLWSRQWRQLLNPWLAAAFLLVLLIAFPWYWLVHRATDGAFTRGFFLEHNIDRFREPKEGHGGIFLMVPLYILIGLLPFSLFFFRWKKTVSSAAVKNPLFLFSLVVVLVFVLFFSLSGTKLPNYPMPCYPFAAILLGIRLQEWSQRGEPVGRWFFIVSAILYFLLAMGGFLALNAQAAVRPEAFWAFAFLLPVAGFVAAWAGQKRESSFLQLLSILPFFLVFNLLLLGVVYPAIYRHNPVRSLIGPVRRSKEVFAYKMYNSAFNFQLPHPVIVFDQPAALKKALDSAIDPVIISRKQYLTELDSLPLQVIGSGKDLFENPTTVILKGSKGSN